MVCAVPPLLVPINPCLSCGACCAYYRASFYWAETEEFTPGGVPSAMTTRLTDFRLAMKGTCNDTPRCIALKGFIGRQVACSIYERRPSVCRAFEAAWQNQAPNPDCDKARRAWGLEPLSPDSWFGPAHFPKAA